MLVVQPRPGTRGTRARDRLRRLPRRSSSARRRPPSRTCATTSRTSGCTRARARVSPTLHPRATTIDIVHAPARADEPAGDRRRRARAGVPVVCTVRDYWPVCYWSDLIHTRDGCALCPAARRGHMMSAASGRAPAPVAAGAADDPLHAREPRARSGRRSRARTPSSPSARRSPRICARARRSCSRHADRGHSESGRRRRACARRAGDAGAADARRPTRSTSASSRRTRAPTILVDVVEQADLDWPLVIAGDGPDRARSNATRRAHPAATSVHRLGRTRSDAASWLAHASMLIFPSRGPESLSRVLIEASALGIPIAAMDTGGTPDIIEHEVTGLLSDVARGAGDGRPPAAAATQALRRRLGAAARAPRRRSSSTPPPSSRGSKRLYRRAIGSAARVSRPLRVALVARSVFPLHGYGGLERHVYDLARHLAERDVEVTLDHARRRGSQRPAPAPIHPACPLAVRAVPHVPAGRTARDDGARSQHGVSALRPARRDAARSSSSRRGDVDIVHGFGASVLGYAAAAPPRCRRRSC